MQKLDPKAVWLFFMGSFLRGVLASMLIVSLIVLTFLEANDDSLNIPSFGILGWSLIIIIPIIFFAYSLIWAKLTYRFYMYELRENGFHKEFGIIWKKYVFIPYDKIQNIDIHRGLIARVLGLSNLRIQTAGVSGPAGPEGMLPGLSKEVAEQLKDEIVKKRKSHIM